MSRKIPLGNLEITDEFFGRLQAEDRELYFQTFDHEDAIAVGLTLLSAALEGGQSIAAGVWLGEQSVFQLGVAGTSADNDHWLHRKAATVRRYDASSFLAAARWADYGRIHDVAVGVDTIRCAFAEGAVPIRIGRTQVGVVAATGVNDFIEHDLVVESLNLRLKFQRQHK